MRRCARAMPGSVVVVVGEVELLGLFRRRARGSRSRRLGRQAEVREDFFDHVGLLDHRDELASTHREDAVKEPSPRPAELARRRDTRRCRIEDLLFEIVAAPFICAANSALEP